LKKGSPENLLLAGEIVRPHGLDGRLKIRSYVQSEKSFLQSGVVFLKPRSGGTRAFTVSSVKPHKNNVLLTLKGLDSLEEAEEYRGAAVFIRRDSLVQEETDEYFWFDLIGLEVYLDTGKYIGTIHHILPTGSNDVYVVREGETEVLVPAIHEVVKEIDLDARKMIITEMEGLLDLNEV
jgi:16S rRNA processing protein RimM